MTGRYKNLPSEVIRVAKLEHDGGYFIVPAEQVQDMFSFIDDWDDIEDIEYKITFTTMDREKFNALPEFEGF